VSWRPRTKTFPRWRRRRKFFFLLRKNLRTPRSRCPLPIQSSIIGKRVRSEGEHAQAQAHRTAQHTQRQGRAEEKREALRIQRPHGAEVLTTASFLADASLASSSAAAHPPRKSLVTSSAALPPLAPRAMNPSASAAISRLVASSAKACGDGRLRLGGGSSQARRQRKRERERETKRGGGCVCRALAGSSSSARLLVPEGGEEVRGRAGQRTRREEGARE
jgi:hypothetical protein